VLSLSKPELGTKRDCPGCGAKFYDLNKNPVVCPKCEHEYVPDTSAKAKRAKPAEKPKEKPVKPVAVAEDDDTVSLDAMRENELAADDDDIDVEDVDVEDDDSDDDAFLADEDDEDEDVAGIVRSGKGGDDD
tara:strand:+ start:8686 stop:9081 length:396 start_codon:yes stop_codon:yes gene_type:complete